MPPAPNRFQYAPSFIGIYQHLLFVTFSIQLIFSIFRHIHIENSSNSFLFALVNVKLLSSDLSIFSQQKFSGADSACQARLVVLSHHTLVGVSFNTAALISLACW